ncbi:TlpA disulfide reductase family protein [Paludisphaera sp.]|uniref:TlpA disulfide reductase family protein n=1 Tax=Paludisphaera sp. TaxID=2017432 RepID=UPI00301CE9E4
MIRNAALLTLGLIACLALPGLAAEPIALQRLTWDQFQKHLASPPEGTKFTVVDAWATTCGPCKENFPHLVEMHKKYASKGLAVVSLSIDDPEDAKAVADAEEFLREQKADFTNVLLEEEFGLGYEKLDIGAIPAVFLFGPDGKEVKRFTMDDPNNQFTYDEVEKDVVSRLDAGR